MSRSGAAVLGSPIAHSLSPVLHQAAYDQLDLVGWSYRAVECDEAGLADALRALDAEGLAGVSLTMPLKQAVMGMLATVDPWAGRVDAANTVVFPATDPGAGWHGANTDVPGLAAVLHQAGAAVDGDEPPLVIGAGATAASALAALADLGCRSATVAARREAAGERLRPLATSLGMTLTLAGWDLLPDLLDRPLVVSTTPSGATDALAGTPLRGDGLLFDVVYSPWPTRLAAAWSASGGRVIGGLELLVEQAVDQVELMTGRRPDAGPMRDAGYAALERASRPVG